MRAFNIRDAKELDGRERFQKSTCVLYHGDCGFEEARGSSSVAKWTRLDWRVAGSMLSAHNTTVSSITLDSAGVIGMWVVCLCMNCEYMPLDEEIMTLRQDLLLAHAVDDLANHLLLCPKCETPLVPRLYYDIKTFQHGVMACGADDSIYNHQHHQNFGTPSSPTSSIFPVTETLSQTEAAALSPAQAQVARTIGSMSPSTEVAEAESVVLFWTVRQARALPI